ncbi:PAS domain-containing protein [Sphingomonas naphthae]|uniref:histidine kinase n=1 Tax=Sphingomonas naphthae TaxID=1813468 RepID=A0ABY7TRK1_9SPHN|nr:PAS domain-containing protein [Sphingomonas naphthae]WCT75311.1 PAS domain-containing protein [Sphingomonas naphthae]
MTAGVGDSVALRERPWTEADRLAALASYAMLDTPTEPAFDEVAQLASRICGTPIAVVNLIGDGRQFFKAEVGLGVRETPLETSFCAKAILEEDFLLVPDATQDARFDCNPLVTGDAGLRFYAGALLKTETGLPIGTLCVLDTRPRQLTALQQDTLRVLARQVMAQLDLRRAVAEQQRTSQRDHFILESATDYAIISMDREGRVTSWNAGAAAILGWDESEMLGQPCDRFFTPEDVAAGVPAREMAAALTTGHGRDERWHLRQGGDRFWANGEMMPLTDDVGRSIGFIKILRDRTEQHLEAKRLEAIEERFQLALEASGFVGAWDWDVASDRVYADASFSRAYGVTVEEGETGLPIARFIDGIHPDDREFVLARIAETLERGGAFAEEYRLVHAAAGECWVLARGLCARDEAGNPTHFNGVAIDITERRKAEIGRAESETRTELALAAVEMGTWETTPELETQVWDARTRELLGHTPDEPIDFETSFMARVHSADRDRVRETIAAALAPSGGLLDIEYRTVDRDGRQRWVHVRGALIAGAARRFVGTVRDISQYKATEEHRALLIAELQHRIKNTMAVVQAIVSQSLRTAITPAAASEAIGNRIAVLAQAHDLLTHTSWTAAPITAIVDGAIRLQGGRSARIRVEGPEIYLSARAALALSMALHELATNATKYGALSRDIGHVAIHWAIEGGGDDRILRMEWRETGGPAVTAPDRPGFGTRLMKSLARDLGGTADLDYAADGVVWRLTSQLRNILETPVG